MCERARLSCFVSGPDVGVGGSPRIYAGEGALQRSEWSFRCDLRFSAGGSEEARSVYGSRLSCFVSGPDVGVGGSPRIYAGEGALQRSEWSFRCDLRFSAGGSEEARSVYGSRLSCFVSGPDVGVGGSPRIYAGGRSASALRGSSGCDLRFSAGGSEEARSVYGAWLSCFVSGPDLGVGGSPRIYAGRSASALRGVFRLRSAL